MDDLEGVQADETVTFALDGISYEIDLTHDNAEKLRELLAPYTDKGRRQSSRSGAGRGRAAARGAGRAPGGDPDTDKVRAWAKENGLDVKDRGRVPGEIRKAYEKAHS